MFPDIALGPEWEAAWTQKQMPPADKVAKQVVGLVLELVFAHGPFRLLLRRIFSPVPEKDIDRTIYAASCRIIGIIHLAIQIPLAYLVLCSPTLKNNPFYAVNGLSHAVVIISGGYFLYDVFVCITRDEGLQYLIHALVCGAAYGIAGFTGKLHYWGSVFLLWELSTPFVYIRWFLYKAGQDKGILYILNGIAMIVVFAACRNVFGTLMCYQFCTQAWTLPITGQPGELSRGYLMGYGIGCIVLCSLNFLWLFKMVQAAVQITKTGKTDKKE